MNTSINLDPGNTDGFDEFAGKRWIYPNNMEIRAYQKQAVEKALFHNAMIVLPTGFGKTFIAAVVMYNFYLWYPEGKIIFVAPTRPLVAQQITSCKAICGFSSAESIEMTGIISRDKRVELWKTKRIFFATPQCIDNDLKEGVAPAKDIKCIVIDEAHRAQGGYAYVNILRILHERNRNGFRVLALSATPGSDIEKVKQVMLNLYISDVMFRSEQSLDLLQFRNQKSCHAWALQLTGAHKKIVDQYIALTKPFYQQLCAAGLTFGQNTVDRVKKFTLIKATKEGGRYGGKVKYMAYACTTLSHQFEVLTLYGMRIFYRNIAEILADTKNSTAKTLLASKPETHKMMRDIESLFGEDINIEPDKVPKNDLLQGHPKLRCCQEIITKHFTDLGEVNETRVMVFTTFRDSVYDIVQTLRKFEPLIKPVAFVGQGKGSKGNSSGMKQREQIQTVADFKNGKYNVLVATCVAEEGLDIGEVDLLICYDTKASPISTVQRRGRTGRKRAGVVHTLLTAGYEDKALKSSSNSRRQVEDQLLKRENYMDVRYRDAPRMVPAHIHPVFFPQKIYAAEEPETPAPEPKRKRRRVSAKMEKSLEKSSDKNSCKKSCNDSFKSAAKLFYESTPEGSPEPSQEEQSHHASFDEEQLQAETVSLRDELSQQEPSGYEPEPTFDDDDDDDFDDDDVIELLDSQPREGLDDVDSPRDEPEPKPLAMEDTNEPKADDEGIEWDDDITL